MSIERIFYCDQRDCERHVRTVSSRPRAGWMFVTDHPGPTLHFCGWDCVLKHAGEKPPEVIVPFGEADEGAI